MMGLLLGVPDMAQKYYTPKTPPKLPDFTDSRWTALDSRNEKAPFPVAFRLSRTTLDPRLVEAGGVEPPSEDSLLSATTCVSGHLTLSPDPRRQGSFGPSRGRKARPSAPEEASGLSRESDLLAPIRAFDGRGRRLKPPELTDSRWRLLVSRFYEVQGLARNPRASTSPSKPFRPLTA